MTKPVGIIGAMNSEVELLLAEMKSRENKQIAGVAFSQGFVRGKPVVIAQCGVGKVTAAICAQAMIDHYGVSHLINTGVAGGLYRELSVGDLVVATNTIEHDFDCTKLGDAKGYVFIGEDNTKPTRIPADPEMGKRFSQAAETILTENKFFMGTIVSGDIFVDDSTLKKELVESYDAYAAEMEGAAIARVAYANEVPFVVVRSISDLAEKGANMSFAEFEKKAAAVSSAIVLTMLEQWN